MSFLILEENGTRIMQVLADGVFDYNYVCHAGSVSTNESNIV